MARIRTIKPEHWKDEDMAKVSLQADLLFIAIWNFADDSGCIRDDCDYLKSEIFPWRKDVKPENISVWLEELKSNFFVLPFQYKNSGYLLIRTFKKHQRIDKPQASKIPQTTINQVIKQYEDKFKLFQDNSENNQGVIQEPLTKNPIPLQEPVTTYSNVVDSKGKEINSIVEEGRVENPAPGVNFIPSIEEIIKYYIDKHSLSKDQATLIAQKYNAVRKKFQLQFSSKYFCHKNGIEIKSKEELEADLEVWIASENKFFEKTINNINNFKEKVDYAERARQISEL